MAVLELEKNVEMQVPLPRENQEMLGDAIAREQGLLSPAEQAEQAAQAYMEEIATQLGGQERVRELRRLVYEEDGPNESYRIGGIIPAKSPIAKLAGVETDLAIRLQAERFVVPNDVGWTRYDGGHRGVDVAIGSFSREVLKATAERYTFLLRERRDLVRTMAAPRPLSSAPRRG